MMFNESIQSRKPFVVMGMVPVVQQAMGLAFISAGLLESIWGVAKLALHSVATLFAKDETLVGKAKQEAKGLLGGGKKLLSKAKTIAKDFVQEPSNAKKAKRKADKAVQDAKGELNKMMDKFKFLSRESLDKAISSDEDTIAEGFDLMILGAISVIPVAATLFWWSHLPSYPKTLRV